ncbi:MAG: hypothetical protein U1E10_09930 [Bdellovibrionales bacterium]|jgi:hypothetical protein|nr:hypothetical protein [Bdellovibrionales bacterium]
MMEFTSGYLVFKNVPTLGAAHTLASQLGRLKSDVHLLDVGFLVKGAWVAAWAPEDSKQSIATLVQTHKLESVKVSATTLNAMYSLGQAVEASDTEALIVEADEHHLGSFFEFIEASLAKNWKLLEIRLRKSGPAGAHAFFTGPGGLSVVPLKAGALISVTKTELSGEYRQYF